MLLQSEIRIPQSSKFIDSPLKVGCDLRRLFVARVCDRLAEADGDCAGEGEAASARHLQFGKPVNAHGHDGQAELRGEQPCAAHEGVHSPVLCARAFGEDQNAVAAVNGLAREGEATPEAARLRQREGVEDGDDEEVLREPVKATEQGRACGGLSPPAKAFALHRDGEASAEASGQSREYERMVEVRYVVRDEERGAVKDAQMLFAAHAQPAEKRCYGKDDRVEEREAQPREWEALRPSGVRIMRCGLRLAAAAHDALDVAERGRGG